MAFQLVTIKIKFEKFESRVQEYRVYTKWQTSFTDDSHLIKTKYITTEISQIIKRIKLDLTIKCSKYYFNSSDSIFIFFEIIKADNDISDNEFITAINALNDYLT